MQKKKVDGWQSKRKSKARTATIQRVPLVRATTSKYHIRAAVHSIQPTLLARQHTQPDRPPINSQQQANHNNTSPEVLGPLFPGVRAYISVHIVWGKFRMIPSRTRSEVRSQYKNSKFDLGASTLDAPSPPWEAQRLPESKCRRVCLLLWWICVTER